MNTVNTCYERAQHLQREGYPLKSIQERLLKEGLPEAELTEALCRLKLEIYKRRKGRGVAFMVAGGFLLLIGFFLTVYMFHNDHKFDAIMYGFTITGTALMLYGAYEILN
jgi:hypothetical protein